MLSRKSLSCAVLAMAVTPWAASAAIVSSQGDPNPGSSGFIDDGVISPGEYAATYTGGGSGFGGTVGAGALYMDSDGVNLYIGFQPGNSVNDNVVIHLDTKSGGFTDATMNDTGDPGRNLLTNLTRDVDDPWDLLPDYGLVAGQFGEVLFELTSGSLNFMTFQNDQTGSSSTLAREYAISLASLGSPAAVDFMVNYGSDSNFMSNESIPPEVFNAGGNPGFDNNGSNQPLPHEFRDQFVLPEPGTLGLIGLAAVGLLRRTRRA